MRALRALIANFISERNTQFFFSLGVLKVENSSLFRNASPVVRGNEKGKAFSNKQGYHISICNNSAWGDVPFASYSNFSLTLQLKGYFSRKCLTLPFTLNLFQITSNLTCTRAITHPVTCHPQI